MNFELFSLEYFKYITSSIYNTIVFIIILSIITGYMRKLISKIQKNLDNFIQSVKTRYRELVATREEKKS